MGDWRIERLAPKHVRTGFDCGKLSLNEFLRVLVSQYEKRDIGRTYVALEEGNLCVLGYYTPASGAINAESLPAGHAKKLPRHAVPVVLLARLAVDRSVHGKGLGGFLLRDALTRSICLKNSVSMPLSLTRSMPMPRLSMGASASCRWRTTRCGYSFPSARSNGRRRCDEDPLKSKVLPAEGHGCRKRQIA